MLSKKSNNQPLAKYQEEDSMSPTTRPEPSTLIETNTKFR